MFRGTYDLAWVQYTTPTVVPLALTRLACRQLIVAVHVAASHFSVLKRQQMRWFSHAFTRTVCVSETVARGFFSKRRPRNVVVLPNALDTQAIRQAPRFDWHRELGWPAERVIIGFAGRLTPLKGIDVLVYAVARLIQNGLPLGLVLVGDGTDREPTQDLVQKLGIEPFVHLAGRLSRAEIFGAIKGFTIGAMPSRPGLEGFGLSALEAMAAGVPLVASGVDALREVIVDNQTGLLCEADTPESLARTLARLIADPALQARLSAAGPVHAAALYDRSRHQARMLDLLASMGFDVPGSVASAPDHLPGLALAPGVTP